MRDLLKETAERLWSACTPTGLDREMDSAAIFRALDGLPGRPNQTLLLYTLNHARIARRLDYMPGEAATRQALMRDAVHLACLYLVRSGVLLSYAQTQEGLVWTLGSRAISDELLTALQAASPFLHVIARHVADVEASRRCAGARGVGTEEAARLDRFWRERDVEIKIETVRRFGATATRFHGALQAHTDFGECRDARQRLRALGRFLVSCEAALKDALFPSNAPSDHRGFVIANVETTKTVEPRLSFGLLVEQDRFERSKWTVALSFPGAETERVAFKDAALVLPHCVRLLRGTTTAWLSGLRSSRPALQA